MAPATTAPVPARTEPPARTPAAESQSDNTDGKDNADNKNNEGSSDQQSAPEPLTDDERADILSKAEQTATESGNELITYTYCVASKGEVGDLTEFSDTVFSTLNDPRGWPRAGAVFQEADGTDPNACSMTLTLAAADQMTSFSTECSDEYSCRVGNDVVINVDRWNNATEGWLNAGGTVSRYRTMVINHEVGHRLGHLDNELTCSAVEPAGPAHAATVDGPAGLHPERVAARRGTVGERVTAAPVTGSFWPPRRRAACIWGNAYAALAAWLGARAAGGRVLLRIEDIDAPRVVKDADRWIMDDLTWLGLDWDGDAVYQSQRLDAYEEALRRLREMTWDGDALGCDPTRCGEGSAAYPLIYPCFCSRADIRAASAPNEGDGFLIYPGTCRRLPESERRERIARGGTGIHGASPCRMRTRRSRNASCGSTTACSGRNASICRGSWATWWCVVPTGCSPTSWR